MVDWPEQQAFNPNRRQISLLLVNEFEPENQLPVKEWWRDLPTYLHVMLKSFIA